MYYTYLFCLEIVKIYLIRPSFIYFANLNFNPDVHAKAQMTTTHKGPIMTPQKFIHSLCRPYILPKKTVTHLGDSFAPINVSDAQKFRETALRVGQCSWCCRSGRSQAMCC